MDDILKMFGVREEEIKDYDDLNPDEQETYRAMLDVVDNSAITLEDVKKHIITMRRSVEDELSDHERNDRKDLFLKARLKNYLLLEAIFERPQRAREMIKGIQMRNKMKKLTNTL